MGALRRMTKLNDTVGAREYAANTEHNASDVNVNWWQFFSGYRIKRWRAELRTLVRETGISIEDVCDYLDLTYNRDIGFMAKLPKKRSMYIGIGMAFGQSVETINRWLTKYCMRQKLYAKDISEDLIWIYLIQANEQDRMAGGDIKTSVNYFRLFDDCAAKTYTVYCQLWNDIVEHTMGTDQVSRALSDVSFDEEFEGLGQFVADHMDAFKTAYVKPRKMLSQYVDMILTNIQADEGARGRVPLNTMRGYLDDSMINYLSGTTETVNVLDRKSGQRTMNIKQIPKSRKTHIAVALALGMISTEVDEYLELMGFTPLDATSQEEGILINFLSQWEQTHTLPQKLKQKMIDEDASVIITDEERAKAVQEMLLLRQDLNNMYTQKNLVFPYMNN